jgi:Asp-tRNA(Asn)/Glu-tRNA(Gln) amidotransferase A subunit family amidase
MLHRLTAWEAARRLATRELSAEELLLACLERIAERDPEVQAFAARDDEAALAQARWLDVSAWQGPLHGLPLGVKDIFDTVELPTGYGTPFHAGHRPPADAASVALCRAAGAIVAGKTVTTELANMTPGPTRNPHHTAHTPGGSSSGSAAAVADHMLPLALGTQTAGSIIRPAAYCGVVGYKPSFGRVPRAGVKAVAESLDVVGGFGRSVRCVALLGSVLWGNERLRRWAEPGSAAPDTPRIGFAPTDDWAILDAEVRTLWGQVVAALSPATRCADAALPARFPSLISAQKVVMAYEAARSLAHERVRHHDALSPALRELLDDGWALDPTEHEAGLATARLLGAEVDALFDVHDVLLTPSAHGEAPPGLAKTGDPQFCRAWSLLGLPCVHLPLGRGRHGMPIGLQLVGRRDDDARLLAWAHWVHERLADLPGATG